jgi:ribosomal protein S18 acetylase RimI-like enzyme
VTVRDSNKPALKFFGKCGFKVIESGDSITIKPHEESERIWRMKFRKEAE